MIRVLLATTVLAAGLSGAAFAQDATKPAVADPAKATAGGSMSTAPEQILASSVLGKTVYTGADEEGEAIGEVSDVVINSTAGAEALIVGVGGFLGVGEKNVAIGFDRVTWSDRDGQRILVVSATKEDLQAAPPFERKDIMDGAVATGSEAEGVTTTEAPTNPAVSTDENAEIEQPQLGTTPQMTDPEMPAVDPGTTASNTKPELTMVDPSLLSADKLIGTEVKVADDSKIGEIGDVIMTKDGKVEAYIIDVGGFLGVGQKQVAMSAASVQVMADATGAMMIYSPFTKEQLENHVAYDADAYKANPSGVVLNTPSN